MAKQFLRKMKHSGEPKVEYTLGDIALNPVVGNSISIALTGKIECVHCSRSIKKTFNQGYCYPCFTSLARCDRCLVKPELCHFHKGTCREPEWGEEHCMIPHYVYLANTTGPKVGITRGYNLQTRWVDQGAVSAVVVAKAAKRLDAGLIEVALSEHFPDKTDWRALIKGETEEVDLREVREAVYDYFPESFEDTVIFGGEADTVHSFDYPVLSYPKKATTINLEKVKAVSGTLEGIRGQYIFINGAALNIRKYSGYEVDVEL